MFSNFFKCGVVGWCLEILFTGLNAGFIKHDQKLRCETSLLMFPIYGAAAIIAPVRKLFKKQGMMFRGICYACGIFLTEYATGRFLRRHNRCPWDYSAAKYNIDGLIRLDFAPLWIGTGLLYEKLLK